MQKKTFRGWRVWVGGGSGLGGSGWISGGGVEPGRGVRVDVDEEVMFL